MNPRAILVLLALFILGIIPISTNAEPVSNPKLDSMTTAPKSNAPVMPAMAKSNPDSVHIVKHSFNHRQQIITGSVVMACLALMMVTMNNYNPR